MTEYGNKLKIEKLETEMAVLREDLIKFAGSLLQSGIMELVTDEEGKQEFKINKVVVTNG